MNLLSDVVVTFTNRPGQAKSRIPIDLPRPRMPSAELAMTPEYHSIYRRIWSDIKDEVRFAENLM